MLYIRYFVLVGAALWGVLCIVDGYLPRSEAVRHQKEIDKSTIRISSAIVSAEKLIIDTTLPTILAPVQEAVDITLSAPVKASREALAQISPPPPKPVVTAIPRKAQIRRTVVTRRTVVKRTQEASLSEQRPNFFEGWLR